MARMHKLLIILSFFFAIHLSADTTEYIKLDNGYKVWTKRVGHGPIKVLTLHGGPGCSHEYLEESFKHFFPPDEFEVIYYAQLGSYHSDQPDDLSLWTALRFREEVEQVRKALKLEDFYLYGHSWGGMLAIEYALEYQNHLKGLILSNTPGSIDSYLTYINQLRNALPLEIQNELSGYEEEQDYFNPGYQKLMLEEIYSRHLCRLQPWPEAITATFQHLNETVYLTMQGPSEFVITGNFKDWDRWNDFSKITVPTLVISGRYDTINPADTHKIAALIPQGTAKICENGSHLALYDDEEAYFKAVIDFLRAPPMNNEWLTYIKKATDICGQIETEDQYDNPIIIEWKRGDILSPDLAEFKKSICELASEELAPVELQFLRANPEAAAQELFLSSCTPLLANGLEQANWKSIEETIQASIKQFYLMDLSKFGTEIIKPLMNDIYFFATIKNKGQDQVCGFLMFAVTPALPFGDIKLINLVIRSSDTQRGLEKTLINLIPDLIPKTKRIFLFVRPTNLKALQFYSASGFSEDPHPFQDPNHKINAKYLIPLELKFE